jgi:hypothetical protein
MLKLALGLGRENDQTRSKNLIHVMILDAFWANSKSVFHGLFARLATSTESGHDASHLIAPW